MRKSCRGIACPPRQCPWARSSREGHLRVGAILAHKGAALPHARRSHVGRGNTCWRSSACKGGTCGQGDTDWQRQPMGKPPTGRAWLARKVGRLACDSHLCGDCRTSGRLHQATAHAWGSVAEVTAYARGGCTRQQFLGHGDVALATASGKATTARAVGFFWQKDNFAP